MTPEKLRRIRILQEDLRLGDLTVAGTVELHRLCVELAAEPETADNPATLFTDESSRPDVVHGGDWNERNHRECAAEVAATFLKYGPIAFDAALQLLKR